MTSEAFVYLMLPATTQFVTAGRIVLSTDPLGITTGRFVYGRRYLAREDAVPIDPIELKLDTRRRNSSNEWCSTHLSPTMMTIRVIML